MVRTATSFSSLDLALFQFRVFLLCSRFVSEVSMVCSKGSSELTVGISLAISGISSIVVVLVCSPASRESQACDVTSVGSVSVMGLQVFHMDVQHTE